VGARTLVTEGREFRDHSRLDRLTLLPLRDFVCLHASASQIGVALKLACSASIDTSTKTKRPP
jgi:hypothetical protein